MSEQQRTAFLKDIRQVMNDHGVEDLTCCKFSRTCYLYDHEGMGLAEFSQITDSGDSSELREYIPV